MLKNLAFCTLVTILNISFASANCGMTGLAIMQKQEKAQKVKFEMEFQSVILLDVKSKQKEERKMRHYAKKLDNGSEKSLLTFITPKEIKGSAVLNWREKDSDDQWLYLPALKKLQRIASGSKRKYFMGTDFTFADLDGEVIKDNNYKCLKVEKCQKGKSSCYVIEARPKSNDIKRSTGYTKRILNIEKSKLITLGIEYYDLKNKKFKTAKYLKWRKDGSVWRPDLASMDRHGKHKTFIKVDNRKLNEEIKEVIFSKRYIEKEMHIQ